MVIFLKTSTEEYEEISSEEWEEEEEEEEENVSEEDISRKLDLSKLDYNSEDEVSSFEEEKHDSSYHIELTPKPSYHVEYDDPESSQKCSSQSHAESSGVYKSSGVKKIKNLNPSFEP